MQKTSGLTRLRLPLFLVLLLSLAQFGTTACNRSQRASGPKERIAIVSHGGVGNPFWAVVFNGAKQAAQDLGVELQILFPNQDGNQPGTTQKLSEAISTAPHGIGVTLASAAHCEYIAEARKKGIAVVVYNAQATPASERCPYQAYVGMDEALAGRVSAERAVRLGRVRGRVMVGLTEAGHAGLQARARGISDVLSAKGIRVDVVDLGNDPSAVPSRLKSYAQNHRKDLSAMFIPAPNGLHPLLRLMEEDPTGLGQLYVAGFDLTPLILRAIEAGKMDHTVDQQPWLQGYYTVAQLVHAVRGRFTPLDMNTGVGLVTQDIAASVIELVQKGVR